MHAAEIADLRRAFEAAREFTNYVGPDQDAKRSVTLRTPTDHQVKLAALRAGIESMADPAALALLERALLEVAIVGWANLQQSDIVDTASADAMPFDAALVAPLLDAHPDWFTKCVTDLFERLAARTAAKARASKN